MRINVNSLLTRFLISASVGLLSALVLGGLLLKLMSATQEIVATTRFSQERMSAFTEFQYALDRYLSATASADSYSTKTGDMFVARSLFLDSLRKVRGLADVAPIESLLIDHIVEKAHDVDEILDNFGQVNAQVDQIWTQQGHQAALDDARGRLLPYFQLKDLLRQQILDDQHSLERLTREASLLQARTLPIALICILFSIIACGIVFLLLTRRLTPGLRTIERGAQNFGEGHFNQPIQVGGNDELNNLAATFNSMAVQLHNKQRDMEKLNDDLEQRVAQRTEDLRALNEKLARTDEQRRLFFADIGHELRTPLTIIRGEAQLALRSGPLEAGELSTIFGRIITQSRLMARLVDDLFLIAKAEAGGLKLDIEEVDVVTILQELRNDFAAIAAEIGATIIAPEEDRAPVVVEADPDRLRQMLVSLIDNALQHTKDGVKITLDAHDQGSSIAITVSDDGPGFPPSQSNALFERFKRGQSDTEGSGLGLTVVRALARAHGGSASLGNMPTGGARATIELGGL